MTRATRPTPRQQARAAAYTRDTFLATLDNLGLSQGEFAAIVELQPTTVYHWGRGSTPFPPWVKLLLAAWDDNLHAHILRKQQQQAAQQQQASVLD